MTVQGALQQWLGDLIQVEAVDVQSEEANVCRSLVQLHPPAHASSGRLHAVRA